MSTSSKPISLSITDKDLKQTLHQQGTCNGVLLPPCVAKKIALSATNSLPQQFPLRQQQLTSLYHLLSGTWVIFPLCCVHFALAVLNWKLTALPKCSCSQLLSLGIQQTFHRTANSVTGINLPTRWVIYWRESPKNLYISRSLQETPHLTIGHGICNDNEHWKQALDEKQSGSTGNLQKHFSWVNSKTDMLKIKQAEVMRYSTGKGDAVVQGFWISQKHAGIHCHKDICS